MSKSMKRSATSELNKDNWDEDDEPEDPGIFKAVGQEELSKRVIKVARRRLPNKTSAVDEQKPIFAGFGGFGTNKSSSNTVPDAKNSFSFLSNLNGSSSQPNQLAPTKSDIPNSPSSFKPTSNHNTNSDVANSTSNSNASPKRSKESEYLDSIKDLNDCLLEWLNQCVKKNPSSILTPIFRDYEKHLDSLNKSTFGNTSNSTEQSDFKISSSEISSNPSVNSASNLSKPVEPSSSFKFTVSSENTLNNSKASSINNPPKSSELSTSFKFNVPPKPASEDSSNSKQKSADKPVDQSANIKYNFNSENTFNSKESTIRNPLKPSDSPTNIKFSFSSNASSEKEEKSSTRSPLLANPSVTANSTPLTSSWLSSSNVSKSNVFNNFASNSTTQPSSMFSSLSSNPFKPPLNLETKEAAKEEGDAEDEPPVNDFKPVTEDDALFSQRVKLFIQKDKQYTDRGVGTLFIKETKGASGDKIHQAIVRADTSIGNIIFNIRINADIPTKRMGKNNVMLVCVPLPETKDKKSEEHQKPVPVLLRVKTAEEADKLMEEINKYK